MLDNIHRIIRYVRIPKYLKGKKPGKVVTFGWYDYSVYYDTRSPSKYFDLFEGLPDIVDWDC